MSRVALRRNGGADTPPEPAKIVAFGQYTGERPIPGTWEYRRALRRMLTGKITFDEFVAEMNRRRRMSLRKRFKAYIRSLRGSTTGAGQV